MSKYYTPKRTKNLYNLNSKEPFKLSRSRLELFIECPRCFYLDRRLGVDRPPGFPFSLNSAVDFLLKKEFDVHRANGQKHPLMKSYGVKAIPVEHEKLDEWRDNFTGVQFLHRPTNLLIFGAIDDLWQNPQGEYIVVDYKATSQNGSITELNKDYHQNYKRQIEIYQWLLRKNGCKVSDTSYFVYCNGIRDAKAFDKKLEFDVTIIPYEGNDSWVEKTVFEAHRCLNENKIPKASKDCDYCRYREAAKRVLM